MKKIYANMNFKHLGYFNKKVNRLHQMSSLGVPMKRIMRWYHKKQYNRCLLQSDLDESVVQYKSYLQKNTNTIKNAVHSFIKNDAMIYNFPFFLNAQNFWFWRLHYIMCCSEEDENKIKNGEEMHWLNLNEDFELYSEELDSELEEELNEDDIDNDEVEKLKFIQDLYADYKPHFTDKMEEIFNKKQRMSVIEFNETVNDFDAETNAYYNYKSNKNNNDLSDSDDELSDKNNQLSDYNELIDISSDKNDYNDKSNENNEINEDCENEMKLIIAENITNNGDVDLSDAIDDASSHDISSNDISSQDTSLHSSSSHETKKKSHKLITCHNKLPRFGNNWNFDYDSDDL